MQRYACRMRTHSTLLTVALMIASHPAFAAAAPSPASAETVGDAEFPEAWFWRLGSAGPAHIAMTGKAPPALTVRDWRGDATDVAAIGTGDVWAALKGKVVVVDFWATWCGPCRAALPENVAMVKELKDQGLVVIGVHDAKKGSEKMDAVAATANINYPMAIDDAGKSASAWKVGFWPTYAVIDRAGVVRAIGLQPQHVRAVVTKLLGEKAPETAAKVPNTNAMPPTKDASTPAKDPAPSATSSTPVALLSAALHEGDARRRSALAKFDSCPIAPALTDASQWSDVGGTSGGATSLEALKGKIVVLDFWATWCGPCISSVPHMNEFAREYAAKGVVVIGVCHPRGGEKLAATALSAKIEYPICLDTKGEANRAYAVDSYPDYYLIDRQGRVRGADIGNGNLEAAVELLLAER